MLGFRAERRNPGILKTVSIERASAEHRRETWTASLLCAALALASCGDASPGPPAGSTTAEERTANAAPAGPLTPEYLAGTWCFARLDGEGERGIYVFDSDGSYQVGIAWTGSEYHLEERSDAESFGQSYEGPVEVGPDRFVMLLSHSYATEFRRGPCPPPDRSR
jgi:hypothetical protein